DLRGHESHGVARLERFYVRPLQRGQINPRAQMAVQRETAAVVVVDAANGLGQPATKRAMDLCIGKAREAGMCMARVRHSNHYGIAGYYAMQALEHDMIGVCCTDSGPLAVPTGGRTAMLGSNPIAFAAPADRERPFVLDMATSVVPVGKVEVKARRAVALPLGWAVNEEGEPTTDAEAVLERLERGQLGGLMPLGGLEAGHKGYGLSVMVDILCSVLAGARAGLGNPKARRPGDPLDVNHVVAAIDIAAFGSVQEFKQDLDTYIDAMHRVPAAPGVDRVRVAGEPEFEAAQERQRHGIPLHPEVATSLRALGAELGIDRPL
ncbi:MAG TPA: Ldh family oxidoreductase, partial [Chloroflexota bacterium]|nr:Ldh family oxidoreductase [Chloroflexota bacterium]